MLGAWSLIRFVHVLSAAIWVGGLVVLTVVVIPLTRRNLPTEEAAPLIRTAGRRFGTSLVVILLPIQLVTGLAMLLHRGVNVAQTSSPYVQIFIAKMVTLAFVVAVAGLHGIATARGQAKLSRVLAVGTVVGSVLIILFATALVPF